MRLSRAKACTLASTALAALLCHSPASAQSTPTGKIETVTVTAKRMVATEVKRQAPNVIEVQPVSEIQKLPDVNLAEALQRVPGISLETDSGEGRFVNIRGMDADLNGTSYDGVRLTASNPSSPQSGGRAVAFDAFPSGIMGGVEVIKSLTPDMDAEGLGGVVNLIPRTMPQNREMLIEASAGGGDEALRGSPVWDGQFTGGVRFGPANDMSAILSYDYHSDWRGVDDIEEDYISEPPNKAYDDLQLRWYKYHRIRQGVGGGFTFDVNDNTALFVRAFHSGYTEYAQKHRLELNNLGDDGSGNIPVPSANGTFRVPDAQAQQIYTYSREDVGNDLVEGGGHTEFAGGIVLDARLSWTRGTDKFPTNYGFTFTDPNNIPLVYNNRDAGHPFFAPTNGTDLANGNIYPFDTGDNGPSNNSDDETAGTANLTVPLPAYGYDGVLKFGAEVRARIRRAIASDAVLLPNNSVLSDFGGTDQIYYNQTYNIGPMANLPELAQLPIGPQIIDPSTYEHDRENVYAGYAQYGITIGALDALAGLRIENTNATYTANVVNGNDKRIGPSVNPQAYTDFFPDLNLKYRVTDEFQVRLAYSTSIARPGFNQITAARSIDVPNLVVSEGNPSVKATTANNFDLTAEYYLPDGGIASAGLFYKAFDNYIVPTIAHVPGSDFPPYFSPNQIVELDSFANIGAATAEGVEAQYVQQFKFLPDPFDGFGFDGNVTYVSSRGQIRLGEFHTLPQTSPFNYNAALFYEKGPYELRLAASYVSTNLWAVGGDPGTDLYSQSRLRADFGGSYAITDNIAYYVDVKNITNTKLEFTQTSDTHFPVQREFYGMDFLTGVRVQF
ncbi:MAG TPA: TonB-dependent receptor [Rhizomicrobium sp.]|jgi:TonB-dependent receptor